MMLFFKVSNFNEFFFKNRKSSQIAIFGSIARNIEGWLKFYDLCLIYSQIWLNRPRDACKPPFLQLLPMDHGHFGCIKRFKKIQCLKLVSTFIAGKREDLGCKPMIYNTMLDTCTWRDSKEFTNYKLNGQVHWTKRLSFHRKIIPLKFGQCALLVGTKWCSLLHLSVYLHLFHNFMCTNQFNVFVSPCQWSNL